MALSGDGDDDWLRAGDHPNLVARRAMAAPLRGEGIEFGPGCHPAKLGPFVTRTLYCDKLSRAEFVEVFPEATDYADNYPDPLELHLDFEREDLVERLGEASQDFLVASHVLEHLVNPLAFLHRCHRLLRPDGLLYLVLPDPRAANDRSRGDRDRRRTSLANVVDRYHRQLEALPDSSIVQIVNETEQPEPPFSADSPDYHWRIDRHRRRSLHINVWLLDDLIELLVYLGRSLHQPWKLVDGLVCSTEYLLLVARSSDTSVVDQYPTVLSRILYDSQKHAMQEEIASKLEETSRLLLDIHDRILRLDERMRETQRFIQRMKSILKRLPGGRWWARAQGTDDS